MELDELIDAQLNGGSPVVPADLQAEFDRALQAHRAMEHALGETFLIAEHDPPDRRPPDLPNDYELLREIGHGGMGVVYLARQKSLGREVALKVLRPGEILFGPLVRRFLDEARHLARLRHPNIVAIHEIGDAAGEPFFTMDYIPGESLATLLKRGPLSPSQAVGFLNQMAAAVQHAHRQGIIHRDLKPSNILVDPGGHVFVTDFGLARDLSQEARHSVSGAILGTPQYMAPEQARGQTALIGEATDVHALGMILYEMLSGRPPYGSDAPLDVLQRILHAEPVPLRKYDRRIPRDLETICLKMLSKSPTDRYANVSAVLEDLRRYEAGESLVARRVNPLKVMLRRLARHWKIAAAVLVTAVVVSALGPVLFDKSYDDLMAWGNEELAAGNAEIAAGIFTRALNQSTDLQRQEVIERIIRTAELLGDSRMAVDLALTVLPDVPDRSFGKLDYLVSQALVAEARAKSPHGAISIWDIQPRSELELIHRRLRMALDHFDGTPQQREEAKQTLAAIEMILSEERPQVPLTHHELLRLPTGTERELRAIVEDAGAALWNRGKAAFALGRQLQESGARAEAMTMYWRAYEFLRRVYPTYAGMKASEDLGRHHSAPDSQACLLIQELVHEIRRLDPAWLEEPRGEVRFLVEGDPLPEGVNLILNLELCDPDLRDPNEGLSYNLPRLVPLQPGVPVRLGVLDGTYRLQVRGTQSSWNSADAERRVKLLQVDHGGWPERMTVADDATELPPVYLRLAEEIGLQSPANADRLDLNRTTLKWSPVNGAITYRVQLSYTQENPSPSVSFFLTVETGEPALDLSRLIGRERELLTKNLVQGRTGGWRVDAFDADGRLIGKSLENRQFLVVRGIAH